MAQTYFFRTTSLPVPNKGEGDELWLYGFVDYTDEFGQSHRGGYARVYIPEKDDPSIPVEKRNNLSFVSEPGWNYDRPLPDDNDAT